MVSSEWPYRPNYCLCLSLVIRPPPAAQVSQALGDYRRQQHKSPRQWEACAASSTSLPGIGRRPPPAAQVSQAVGGLRRQQHIIFRRIFIIENVSIRPYRIIQANACFCDVDVHAISFTKMCILSCWGSRSLGVSRICRTSVGNMLQTFPGIFRDL